MKGTRVFAIRKDADRPFDGEIKWSIERQLPQYIGDKKEIRFLIAKSYTRPSSLLRTIEDGDYVAIFSESSRGDRIVCIEVSGDFRDYLSRNSTRSTYDVIKDYDKTYRA